MVSSPSSAAPPRGSGPPCPPRGHSTGPTNLIRILDIISAAPQIPFPTDQKTPLDLQHRRAPAGEIGWPKEENKDRDCHLVSCACSVVAVEETANSAAHQIVIRSFFGGLSGECDERANREGDKEGRACSVITNIGGDDGCEERRSREAENAENNKQSGEGYLWLLLDAVRQVSGEIFDFEEEGEKKKGAALELVVRSKRGRRQVLPSRSKQARRCR